MDQIRRGVEWLRQKNLVDVTDITNISLSLGKNGLEALKNGLPERRLVNLVKDDPKILDEVRSSWQGPDFNAAVAHARKNDWISIEKISCLFRNHLIVYSNLYGRKKYPF